MVHILEAMLGYPRVVCHRRSRTNLSRANLALLPKTYCDHTTSPRRIEALLVQPANMEIKALKLATTEAEAHQVAANHTSKVIIVIKQGIGTVTNYQARSSISKTTVVLSFLLQAEAAWKSKNVLTVLPQVTQ